MITRIDYNWCETFDSEMGGEDYYKHQVGEKDVVEITEHRPDGEGDKWFYDVKFSDGKIERIFNPNKVYFGEFNF